MESFPILRATFFGLLLTLAVADTASAVIVVAEVRASRGGLPTQGAVVSTDVNPNAEPDVAAIEFANRVWDLILIGGGVIDTGTFDEALEQQVPVAKPTPAEKYDWLGVSDSGNTLFDLATFYVAASGGIDIFGLLADPDPFLALNVAYENPDGSLTDPLEIQHFTSTELVPLAEALGSVSVVGLLLEDGDGDGNAAAQAFLSSAVGNVAGTLPGGQVTLLEPGLAVMGWEGGPITPEFGPALDALFMNLDLLVTPGDRVSAFAATILQVPEPSTLPLCVFGLAAVAAARRCPSRSTRPQLSPRRYPW